MADWRFCCHEDSRLDRIRRSCLVDVASLLAAVSEIERVQACYMFEHMYQQSQRF